MRRFIPLAAAVLALAACGGEAEPEAEPAAPAAPEENVVELLGDEYHFAMPETIEGGWTTIRFTNTGEEPHEFAVAKLADGKTMDDVHALLSDTKSQQGPPPEWVEIRAGVPTVDGGTTVAMTQKLEPGTYVLLCFLPAPDGKSHIEHGMLRGFEVKGDAGAPAPEADATLALDSWKTPPPLPAGETTIELRDDGGESGSIFFTEFKPGKTEKDLTAWENNGLRGPAPARFLGGAIDVPAGGSVFYTLELESGREYTLLDDIRGVQGAVTPS